MDKKQTIKQAINKFLPENTPFKQLNFKNKIVKSGQFEDPEMKNSLYNTKISNYRPDGKQLFPKDVAEVAQSGAEAYYSPGDNSITTLNEYGEKPSTIKHELLHKKFSKESGEQQTFGRRWTSKRSFPLSNVIGAPVRLMLNNFEKLKEDIAKNKQNEFVNKFNSEWDKEKNKLMSSRKISAMKAIDKHIEKNYRRQLDIEDSPFSLPPTKESKATERNSYLKANQQEFEQ